MTDYIQFGGQIYEGDSPVLNFPCAEMEATGKGGTNRREPKSLPTDGTKLPGRNKEKVGLRYCFSRPRGLENELFQTNLRK